MNQDDADDAGEFDRLGDVVVPFRAVDEAETTDFDDLFDAVVPVEFHPEEQADETHEQKGGVFQPRLPFEQLDAVARHQSQGDDAQRHADINQHFAVACEGHGGDDVVKAQAQIEKSDHRNRVGKAVRGRFGRTRVIRILLVRKMGAHQPHEVERTQQHQPVVVHDEAGSEQGHDAEAISPDVADVHRLLALLFVQMGCHRGNGQRIVHGEKSFDQDQGQHHGDALFHSGPDVSGGENFECHQHS